MAIPSDVEAELRASPLLEGLSSKDLEQIWELGSIQNLPVGTTLTQQGRAGTEAYLILEGLVTVKLPDGRREQSGPGEIVGEMAPIADTRRVATCVVSEPVRAVILSKAVLERLMSEFPSIAGHLNQVLAARRAAAEQGGTA